MPARLKLDVAGEGLFVPFRAELKKQEAIQGRQSLTR